MSMSSIGEDLSADFCIIGAGIAGLALANALVKEDFSVILVEKKCLGKHASPSDTNSDSKLNLDRVVAVNKAFINILENLEVWEKIKQYSCEYNSMYIFEQGSSTNLELKASDANYKFLGYIVPNDVITEELYKKILLSKKVKIIDNQEINSINNLYDSIVVKTSGNFNLKAKLLCACDGANSNIASFLGIEYDTYKYSQQAIVTTVKITKEHNFTAWQNFTESGPLAFLPLKNNKEYSIVWSHDNAEEILKLSQKELSEKLTLYMEGVLGEVNVVGNILSFPLIKKHAFEYGKDRCVLLADAAHVIHPLAGQGINLGALDVADLVDILVETRNSGRDLGSDRVLSLYQLKRKAKNKLIIDFTDFLYKIFKTENFYFRQFINTATKLLNRIKLAKLFMINIASGLYGVIPSLAKVRRN